MRKPKRQSLRETIADNRQHMELMSRLIGAPKPVFSEMSTDKPKRAYKPRDPAEPTEAQILKSIMAYLRVEPRVSVAIRINSGSALESHNDVERYVQYNSQQGMSDICGNMVGGMAFYIEVKSKSGRLSQAQDDFLCARLESGALAGVARSIDDARKVLGLA